MSGDFTQDPGSTWPRRRTSPLAWIAVVLLLLLALGYLVVKPLAQRVV